MRALLTCLALGVFLNSASADDFQHWKEPPYAPISPTGTVMSVESIRCEVKGPRTIECLNIGRVCVDFRRKQDEDSAKRFGCASADSPNHPCPEYKTPSPEEINFSMSCTTMLLGGF